MFRKEGPDLMTCEAKIRPLSCPFTPSEKISASPVPPAPKYRSVLMVVSRFVPPVSANTRPPLRMVIRLKASSALRLMEALT